jgi:hypothetical protein
MREIEGTFTTTAWKKKYEVKSVRQEKERHEEINEWGRGRIILNQRIKGNAVGYLVEEPCYKQEGSGFPMISLHFFNLHTPYSCNRLTRLTH